MRNIGQGMASRQVVVVKSSKTDKAELSEMIGIAFTALKHNAINVAGDVRLKVRDQVDSALETKPRHHSNLLQRAVHANVIRRLSISSWIAGTGILYA
jgi:hypothetical protein